MTYTAQNARDEFNAEKKEREFQKNMELIRATTRAGGREVAVEFNLTGRETMAAKLRSAGYTTENTHGHHGLLARW